MRLIHCGDLHLDTVFSGLGSEACASVRQAELRRTFLSVIELAKEADALLIAGDLFDQDSVEAETIRVLCEGFASLGDIPVLIAAGNHDPLGPKSYYELVQFPSNVHVFGTELSSVTICGYNFYGISFGHGTEPEPLLSDFHPEPGRPSVLLMHGDLGGGAYNPVDREMIAASGLSYLALGHVHTYEETKLGQTLCVYPGCPEGRGFDELDEKGVVRVELTETGVKTEFIPVCCRSFRTLSVDVTDCLTHEAILSLVRKSGLSDKDLYKIILEGETELQPDTTVLAEALSECFFVKFYDKTKRPLELAKLMQEPGIRGMFARKFAEGLSGENAERYRRALEIGLAALDGEKVKPQ